MRQDASHAPSRWVPLLLGLALLTGVVIVGTHFSEEEAFVRLAREARPSWFAAALTLQAGTYLAEGGEIWRTIGRMVGARLRLPFVCKLALAKLFVDQALPSAGISGTVAIAKVLEQGALPRPAVLAGFVVHTTSFFIAYVAALGAALMILFVTGRANSVVVTPIILFMLVSSALTVAMMALSGKDLTRHRPWPAGSRIVDALRTMKDADPGLVRNGKLQAVSAIYQLIIFLLDAVTLWTLIRSLGAMTPLSQVYVSFMVANLVRTISFIPGGLGTFEAAAVVMLKRGGLRVAIGLSATLLFRGLTFFLPMAPGLWFSRALSHPWGMPRPSA